VLQAANVNTPVFVERIVRLEPDLGISISCDQILRRKVLDSARLGFLNFHAGLLPCYRGRNVINWAIINGETQIGVTAHMVDEGIDTGDIVLQRSIPIEWTDSYDDVLERIVDALPAFVIEAVRGIESGELTPRPQRHLEGTYFSGREDGDEWLDWSDTSFNIYNKVRAISRPAPGARTLLGDRVVVVWKAAYDRSWPKYIGTPGQVVGRVDEGVVVKTGDSTLVLQEIQVADGACERPAWRIGTRLGVNLMDVIRSLQTRVRDLEAQLSTGEKRNGAGSSR
jgi:methionyl-tRNA formyltransferase